MPETEKDPWTRILDFLSQIITPSWGDLINLIPFALMLLALAFFAVTALRWQQAGALNRPRVPQPLSSGALPPGVHLPGPSRWPFVVPIGALFILLGLALRPRGPGTDNGPLVNVPLLLLGLLISAVAIGGWLWDAMREWRRTEGLETAGPGHAALAMGPAAIGQLHAGRGGAVATVEDHAHDLPPGVHLPGPSPWPFFAPLAMMFVLFGLVLSPALIIGGLVMAGIAIAGWLRDAGSEYRQTEAGIAPEPRTRDPRQAFPVSLVKVYIVIAALSVAAIVGPGVITTVITRPTASGGTAASPGASGPVAGGPLSITAKDIKFATDKLVAPAGKPFDLTFDNEDAQQHDVSIYAGSDASAPNVFRGEIFAGPKTVTYHVPQLKAGSYYFQCDVHPNMKGTLDAH